MSSSRTIIMLMLAGCLASPVRASNYALVTEPDQGLTPVYNLIGSAKNTLDMTMYGLTDTQAEQLLAQAGASGVKVRVILDQNLEKSNNTAAYNYLAAHNVQVHWANPKYSATHQKTIIVDASSAAIMTLNLTSQYYSTSRDFAVIENDPNDVAAIEATFNADFSNGAIEPPDGDDLVWSPTNSQSVILSVINSAQHSLLVENEEMGDSNVVNALVSAAGRGVLVQVAMTNTRNAYSAEFSQLVAAGVEVSTYASNAPLYIHAKVILADYGSAGAQVFIGSENFSSASLTRNRELGLTTSDPAIMPSIYGTLARDFNSGTPWPGSKTGLAVVSAASLQPGFSSGGWMTILGASLAPSTDDWRGAVIHGDLPISLDGVSVTVDRQPAYVAYISPTQINAVAPEVNDGPVSVIVNGPNGASTQAMAAAYPAQPAFFQWGGYVVATHQDYSYAVNNGTFSQNTAPAAPGDVIILWGTGLGPTTPAAPSGVAVPSGMPYQTASPVTVTLGNTPVTVFGAALAPGFAALYQIAIQIPESLADGDYPVVAAVSGAQSPSGVLLTVRK